MKDAYQSILKLDDESRILWYALGLLHIETN
jgi:hypothetical protein